EEAVTHSARGGGKVGLGGGGASASDTIEYLYHANFAVAVAEGEISGIGRVWADGQELDLSAHIYRVHPGSETQTPDSLIEAREGAGNAPAFRGTAYIVFERMALAAFGNRLPQLSFEVYREVEAFGGGIRGVVLIPGSGEFVYATQEVTHGIGGGQNAAENVHTRQGAVDWTVSLDQMTAALPEAGSVSLVVSWFGTDLRAGSCAIKPGVELASKTTSPIAWKVAGVERGGAHVVSQRDGRPAYGGTPSDQTVVAAIRDLKARGYAVTLTPFVLMDVPDGNALPSPYGGASQPAYPWRGRITVSPAAGQPGTVDKTAVAASQIAAFVGTAQAGHYVINGDEVVYSGPAEWSFRRMVLHQAWLAKAAGGVDAFVIGTELRGLTWVRSGAATYPFVAALIQLAADVKAILGPATKVIYAADWSEYFGHQPGDGTGDVYFHLDPLWASAAIDAIGIDLYWPLADWRDGRAHLDHLAGVRSTHDLAYLRGNVQGGEGYDWYYASTADRDAQVRSPITDGAGKPWVFRYKDIRSWWSEPHFDRPGGVEITTPTAWTPQSKPFWLMEIGCPAVDKGANQPNVFVDPKSAESALPYYSRGTRDDLMQRRFIMALTQAFDPAHPDYVADTNPLSGVYGGRMVDLARIHVYAWDARPFPAFPYNLEVWGDGENWRFGHWLNGRSANSALAALTGQILTDFGFDAHDATALDGTVPGYVIDRPMSARDALGPLELGYFFDALETGDGIVFRHRGAEGAVATLTVSALVETRAGDALLTLTRGQETELPASAKVSYISAAGDYRQAVAEARRLILPLGQWVLASALRQAVHWHQTGRARVPVAVNLSALQFQAPDFVATIAQALNAAGASGDMLELELTERMLMDDLQAVQTALVELRALGVRLAVDDFGTGYTSLKHLKALTIDRLKIDRCFVQGLP
ncbi:MAG: glycoside hydrolase TIM-barrel-like domain-containing protein, partial [Hyphomicrobium sp.]